MTRNGEKQRAVLYVRVSKEEQAERYGPKYQLHDLRRWADQLGYEVVEPPIEEPGYSRESWNRPGLDKIRELAEAGEIDAVLAWRRDRYFGEPAYRWMFDREMETYGITLRAMDDSGQNSPEGEFLDGIKDLVAKLEIRKTTERTRSGKLQKAREGKGLPGIPTPFGFTYRSGELEVDESRMAQIRRLFRMVGAEGRSIGAVKRALDADGVPTPRGGKYWDRTTLRRMIDNDVYLARPYEEVAELIWPEVAARLDKGGSYGIYWFNRQRVKKVYSGDKKHIRIDNDASEWIAIPTPDPGVAPEWVRAAREAVKNNVRHLEKARRFWQLKGRIFCPCGRRMTTFTARHKYKDKTYTSYYYICSHHRRRTAGPCEHARHFKAQEIENRVALFVAELVTKPEKLVEWTKANIEEERRTLRDSEGQIRAWREELAKVERERERYMQLWTAEVITDIEELKHRMAVLDARKEAVRGELDGLQEADARIAELDHLAADLAENGIRADGLRATAHIRSERDDDHLLLDTYRQLRLKVVAYKDGTLEVSGVFGCRNVRLPRRTR